jgi:hypothetical protein
VTEKKKEQFLLKDRTSNSVSKELLAYWHGNKLYGTRAE